MRISTKLLTALIALLLGVGGVRAQSSGFNLVVVGDPQPQTEAQITSLEEEIIPQIGAIVEEYKATGYPTAILLTGDVVWDTMKFLPRVKADFEALGVPVYAVIGNHDHNKHHECNQKRAERNFVDTFGSRNVAFMLGETLFVTFDNIDYTAFSGYGEKIDADWCGGITEGSVALTDVNTKAAAEGTQATIDAVKAELVAGTRHVFDVAADNFITVGGEKLTSYLVEVKEVVSEGYFHESEIMSAPYFDIRIDGITLLNEKY